MAAKQSSLLRMTLPSLLALGLLLPSASAQGLPGLQSAGFFLSGAPRQDLTQEEFEQEEAEAQMQDALLGEISSRVELFYILLESEKVKAALQELSKIEALNLKGNLEANEIVAGAYLEGAEVMHEMGKSEQAEKMLRKGLKRNSETSNSRGHLLGALAHLLRDLGRSQEAVEYLQESIDIFSQVRARYQE